MEIIRRTLRLHKRSRIKHLAALVSAELPSLLKLSVRLVKKSPALRQRSRTERAACKCVMENSNVNCSNNGEIEGQGGSAGVCTRCPVVIAEVVYTMRTLSRIAICTPEVHSGWRAAGSSGLLVGEALQ